MAIFALIVVVYLVLLAGICFGQKKTVELLPKDHTTPFNPEIEAKLLALEDANRFFGASLKAADMFRLIASRTKEIVPYTACAVFLADETSDRRDKLKLAYASGEPFKKFNGEQVNVQKDLAVETFRTGQPQILEDYVAEEAPGEFNSAMAVPLFKCESAFGVFVLYNAQKNAFDQRALHLSLIHI